MWQVSRALSSLPAVASVRVDLPSKLVRVGIVGDLRPQIAEIFGAISALSYTPELAPESAVSAFSANYGPKIADAETTMVVLGIEGMSCAACSSKVEVALGALNGVSSVSVSLIAASAMVYFDPRRHTIAHCPRGIDSRVPMGPHAWLTLCAASAFPRCSTRCRPPGTSRRRVAAPPTRPPAWGCRQATVTRLSSTGGADVPMPPQ